MQNLTKMHEFYPIFNWNLALHPSGVAKSSTSLNWLG